MHGEGLLVGPDGRAHFGDFRNGEAEGLGTLSLPDGRTCSALFSGGQVAGHAILQWPDGREYTGQVRDGRMHGIGELRGNDGQPIHRGQWRDDEPAGDAREEPPDLPALDAATLGEPPRRIRDDLDGPLEALCRITTGVDRRYVDDFFVSVHFLLGVLPACAVLLYVVSEGYHRRLWGTPAGDSTPLPLLAAACVAVGAAAVGLYVHRRRAARRAFRAVLTNGTCVRARVERVTVKRGLWRVFRYRTFAVDVEGSPYQPREAVGKRTIELSVDGRTVVIHTFQPELFGHFREGEEALVLWDPRQPRIVVPVRG